MSISATEAIRRFAALPGRPSSAFIQDWHVCRRRGRYIVEHTRGTHKAVYFIKRFARDEARAGRIVGPVRAQRQTIQSATQLSLFDMPERTTPQ
jgi:hypothetical protein